MQALIGEVHFLHESPIFHAGSSAYGCIQLVTVNTSSRPLVRMCSCRAAHRSWEVSQSTKVTRVLCTFSDSAVGVGTGGGAWWVDEEPFIISGCCGTSAVPLSGREIRTAVSRHAAFSCVNQSVRCSSLHVSALIVSSCPTGAIGHHAVCWGMLCWACAVWHHGVGGPTASQASEA